MSFWIILSWKTVWNLGLWHHWSELLRRFFEKLCNVLKF